MSPQARPDRLEELSTTMHEPFVASAETSSAYDQKDPSTGTASYPPPNSPSTEPTTLRRYRFLTPSEWAVFAHGVGGVADSEHHSPVHPSSWWWPPHGMPAGLYKDVATQRFKFLYLFHLTSTCRWLIMVSQLCIGSALTALGSLSPHTGTVITTLGAIGTILTGLLGLMQNSGLPDRYRYDMAEFEKTEDHIKELLDTGIVPSDQKVEQILADCFLRHHRAKLVIAANLPATYIPTAPEGVSNPPGQRGGSSAIPARPNIGSYIPAQGGDVLSGKGKQPSETPSPT